ncbi:ankyrin repeat-containing domain protein [Ilyonectria robusta]|uniref:ankyrin repeat-containing domain protein n=1 Tax=Ilyonectria robusta TaxID=1079257 RepID=UPI001E8DDADD|nr:ankyrin repeat-containing domain protein [Ilyonectria robusta]KAH8670055.1 ankyrin repeat-containing domain protein [Ilyonectria robusta]
MARGEALRAAKLRVWSEPGLHLIVTSRDEVDIRDELQPTHAEDISLRNEDIGRDISTFISDHLRNTRRLHRWKSFHDRIAQGLIERADGVFRWVECQFTSLENCPRSEAHLEDLLTSLPRSLDETYERMLLNIDEGSAEYARRTLTFLCCAKEPLAVAEVIEAMAVELGDIPRLNTKRRLHDQDDLHQVCPGLIEVVVNPDAKELSTVRIAHFSVQEYLESERIRQQRVAMFHVETEKANAEIASLCLAYLLEPECDTGTGIMTKISKLRTCLILQKGYFETIMERSGTGSRNGTARSWLNLAYSLHLLSRSPTLVDSKHNKRLGGTISVAVSGGKEAVVRLLLDNGADVNSERSWFRPLTTAAERGNEAMVRLLLDNGADVNPGGTTTSPLSAAAGDGHEAVVRLLLENGAFVNTRCESRYGSTALIAAARSGNAATVRLLLDNGAGDQANREDLVFALENAVEMGSEDVVRLLLENGADVDDDANRAIVRLALRTAKHGIAKLILEHGAMQQSGGG